MSHDLRRRMMGERTSNVVFSPVSGSSSESRPFGAYVRSATSQNTNAVTFTVMAARSAVYRVHLHTTATHLTASPGKYSYLQNDTFPSYVSAIKSSDVDMSFYLPLTKGSNVLRFWTLQDKLLLYGVTVSPVSDELDVVAFGKEMLEFTETPGQSKPQGWQRDIRCCMLRASNEVADTLFVKADTLATIPEGRYRVGLCCAASEVLAVECGSTVSTVRVKSDTNTSTGAAYVDTGIEVEDVASSGLSVKIGDGSGWANVGAIILHRIS